MNTSVSCEYLYSCSHRPRNLHQSFHQKDPHQLGAVELSAGRTAFSRSSALVSDYNNATAIFILKLILLLHAAVYVRREKKLATCLSATKVQDHRLCLHWSQFHAYILGPSWPSVNSCNTCWHTCNGLFMKLVLHKLRSFAYTQSQPKFWLSTNKWYLAQYYLTGYPWKKSKSIRAWDDLKHFVAVEAYTTVLCGTHCRRFHSYTGHYKR